MTSAVALALMAKAAAVFGGSDTFLSFPLTPLSFAKDQLDFLNAGTNPSAALENASQFARIINQMPSGPVWPTVDTGPLWQEYTRVLQQAQLANEQRTPDEDTQYQAALAYLYVTNGGVQAPSAAVIAYNQYRDAYLNAKQQYTSRSIAAASSTDPAVKAQFASDQPSLQASVDAALTAWETAGFKAPVEDARRTEQSLGALSPATTWSRWMQNCDPDVVAQTDLEGAEFMPTAFAPSSAIDGGLWQQFTMAGDEVAQLVQGAPAQLAARLGAGDPIDVASVDFECTSVTVQRPWFTSDVFGARFWKLNIPPTVISDGATPPNGTIPGYTVAIVFARNVSVTLTATSTAPPSQTPLMIGPLHVSTIVDGAGNRTFVRPEATVMARPMVFAAAGPAPAPAPRPTFARSPLFMRTAFARPIATAPAPSPVATAQPARFIALRAVNFQRLPVAPPPSPSPSAPPAAPAPESSDVIFVLGFICKSVPQCPNPDPSLTW